MADVVKCTPGGTYTPGSAAGVNITALGLDALSRNCTSVVNSFDCFYDPAKNLNKLLAKLKEIGRQPSDIVVAGHTISKLDDAYKAAHVFSGYAEITAGRAAGNTLDKPFKHANAYRRRRCWLRSAGHGGQEQGE